MRRKSLWLRAACLLMALLLAVPLNTPAQTGGADGSPKKFSKEELTQILAPIALYPDDLLSQILMASTYPLEVVQADRWAKSHRQSAGDVLAKQLEKESWDPSVKSLVNFPNVLSAMSEKLDVTTKIGDAFLAQEGDVMATIQELRKKAYDAGNLKTTREQKIVVEKETIVIQPATPQVIYVPTYSPTVVYGVWAYPAYPPYYYYPPPPPAYPAYSFAAGVAIGAAWGYAWGHCNWHGGGYGNGGVYINHNQNININNNINRGKYQGQGGRWQHNPEHRRNVAYRDGATARQYGQSPGRSAAATRDSRGFGDGRSGAAADRSSSATMNRGTAGSRESAFGGSGSGRQERQASDRGQASRSLSTGFGGSRSGNSSFSGSGSRSGGSFGGGSRSGGGFGGGGRGGRR